MKKVLLVYLPFCTVATPPYSITAMRSFLQHNSDNVQVDVLDLNLAFHSLKFSDFRGYYQNPDKWEDYGQKTEEFIKLSGKTYSQNNSLIVKGGKPEFFEELLERVVLEKPDIVAFSIVYSSQAFFAKSMIQSLKELGIVTVIEGPAVNKKLIALADHSFSNEIEFLKFIGGDVVDHDSFPDFSVWDLEEYFTPHPVIPLKTSSTCCYRRCAFCAHYNADVPYFEYDMEGLKKTIIKSGQKYFFLIDDMVSKKRLLKFAEMIKPLNCYWACQLRPTKDLDYDTLKILQESGLVMILWGVESGNERILNLIEKGTNPKDISTVLKNASEVGIKNVTYIIFGFPTETKEEFMDTLSFLEDNQEYIDLVSPTVFGLQQGTGVYNNPEKYGITKIIEEPRTVLEPKLLYEVSSGLTQKEAIRLKDRNKKRIEKINNFPKSMNFFREHMMCLINS